MNFSQKNVFTISKCKFEEIIDFLLVYHFLQIWIKPCTRVCRYKQCIYFYWSDGMFLKTVTFFTSMQIWKKNCCFKRTSFSFSFYIIFLFKNLITCFWRSSCFLNCVHFMLYIHPPLWWTLWDEEDKRETKREWISSTLNQQKIEPTLILHSLLFITHEQIFI